jgi:hypothetical protein
LGRHSVGTFKGRVVRGKGRAVRRLTVHAWERMEAGVGEEEEVVLRMTETRERVV